MHFLYELLIGRSVDLVEELVFNDLGHQAMNSLNSRLAAKTDRRNKGVSVWVCQTHQVTGRTSTSQREDE